MTAAPFARAISVVASVLPESTTRISSAHATLSIAAPMCAASLSVMMVTDTFGTGGILPERCLLHCFEVDDRALVVEDRPDLVVARLREVALCLEHEEAGGRAGGELALLRLEPPLGELARDGGRFDPALIRQHLPSRLAHLRHHLHLRVAKLR